ncbi:hypothetical protein QUB63_15575 [Microcoleus sp. ARI1-B5]|uniref:hypothetical protein n=1 Tax=unclassified Microcoleus TaxID=2642155 RepID=UPI002FD00657
MLYYFSGAGRELQNSDSGRSVNLRAWIEGSRARMGDGSSNELEAPTVKTSAGGKNRQIV